LSKVFFFHGFSLVLSLLLLLLPRGVEQKIGRNNDLAAGLDVVDHDLLQPGDLLLQLAHQLPQALVVALVLLDLLLQLVDALQLPLAALGRGDAVTLALPENQER
jgi:hypothetical protein